MGAVALDPGLSIVWCDSEVFDIRGEPTGYVSKLAVNARAAMVGVGVGSGTLAGIGDGVVRAAASLDDLPSAMTPALRREAVRRAELWQARRPDSFSSNAYLATGWSAELGRVVSHFWSGGAFFVPRLLTRLALPDLDEASLFGIHGRPDVLRLARRQMGLLRTSIPLATGGPLVIAQVRRGGVAAVVVDDWFNADAEETGP